MPTTFNMSDVMISYSRRDKVFVQQLEQSLRATGREIWIDWLDIPPTADFLQEIYAGIEAANTFVFVISPDSARSEVCGLEVDHAVKFNKRLIPVLYRDLTDEDRARLHPAIAAHNWIYVREQDNFEDSFNTLTGALDTDLAHVQMHTRLLVRGREWDNKGRSGGFLLRGDDLRDAESWLANGLQHQPEPTALQAEYIVASRKAAARTRQILAGATTSALVILSLLVLFAFQQLGVSNQRGTEVALQVETANAGLTQVQERENARATAQQDAANSLEQANANATLSQNNAATANANAILSDQSAATATSAQGTAGAAQIEAQNNLATATGALDLAAQAQDQAENVLLTATVAQGEAQNNLLTATYAQGQGQQALATAQAAQTRVAQAQSAADLAQTEAVQQQATAQAAQTQAASANATAVAAQTAASVALTNAANAQATANAAGTRAAIALTEASEAKADAEHQQTLAAIAQTEAANAQLTANAANTQAANAQATAAAETARALSLSLATKAREALLNDDRPLAMKLALLATIVVSNPPQEALETLEEIARSTGERYTLEGIDGEISAVGISKDGSKIYAAVGGRGYAWTVNSSASTPFDTLTPEPLNLGNGDRIAFSPDGSMALIHDIGEKITPWQLSSPPIQTPSSIVLTPNVNTNVRHLTLLHDNETFVTVRMPGGGTKATIQRYKLNSSTSIGTISETDNEYIHSMSTTNSNIYILGSTNEFTDPEIIQYSISLTSQTVTNNRFPGWKYAAFAPENLSIGNYMLVIE